MIAIDFEHRQVPLGCIDVLRHAPYTHRSVGLTKQVRGRTSVYPTRPSQQPANMVNRSPFASSRQMLASSWRRDHFDRALRGTSKPTHGPHGAFEALDARIGACQSPRPRLRHPRHDWRPERPASGSEAAQKAVHVLSSVRRAASACATSVPSPPASRSAAEPAVSAQFYHCEQSQRQA